ncbi:hypothetical protein DAMA08_050530 [Martiniozyma asiatica (nom. inval.)]|nr:hypothetical protein DAMA08_050530 [Martiniozyma asiatica]
MSASETLEKLGQILGIEVSQEQLDQTIQLLIDAGEVKRSTSKTWIPRQYPLWYCRKFKLCANCGMKGHVALQCRFEKCGADVERKLPAGYVAKTQKSIDAAADANSEQAGSVSNGDQQITTNAPSADSFSNHSKKPQFTRASAREGTEPPQPGKRYVTVMPFNRAKLLGRCIYCGEKGHLGKDCYGAYPVGDATVEAGKKYREVIDAKVAERGGRCVYCAGKSHKKEECKRAILI